MFLQALVAENLGEFVLPTQMDADIFNEILKYSTPNETDTIKSYYLIDNNTGNFVLSTKYR